MSTPAKERQFTNAAEQGRADLAAWERAQPENYYETDHHLRHILEFYWGADRLESHTERLMKFGGESATYVDYLVRRANQPESLPRLERYSAVGERTEEVAQSPDHHVAGKLIYASGAMSVYAEPGNNLVVAAAHRTRRGGRINDAATDLRNQRNNLKNTDLRNQ